MRRLGWGALNGLTASSGLAADLLSAAVDGSTVMPTPDATMWRIVSSELPSSACCMLLLPFLRVRGQVCSTWSRKQLPAPNRSSVLSQSLSALILALPLHA